MHARVLLAMFIAVVPISVEMGAPDTTRRARDDRPGAHETRLALGGEAAQFSIVRRGCEGRVLDEAKAQVRSGALEVEHVFPNDFLIGARGGTVRERYGRFEQDTSPTNVQHDWNDNVFFGAHAGIETRRVSVALGLLHADHAFPIAEGRTIRPELSARLVTGNEKGWFGMHFMDDVPIETGGYLTTEVGAHVTPRVDAAAFLGLIGPYDGTMVGLKGRVWLTPEAALVIRGGVAGREEYTAGAGVQVRLGRH